MPILATTEVDESICSDDGESSVVEEPPAQDARSQESPARSSPRGTGATPNTSPAVRRDLSRRGLNGSFNLAIASPAVNRQRVTPTYNPVPIREPDAPGSIDALNEFIRSVTRANTQDSIRSQPYLPGSHFEQCLWGFMYEYPRVVRADHQAPYIMHFKNTRNLTLCYIKGNCDERGPSGIPVRLTVLVDMNSVGFTDTKDGTRSDRSRYVTLLVDLRCLLRFLNLLMLKFLAVYTVLLLAADMPPSSPSPELFVTLMKNQYVS